MTSVPQYMGIARSGDTVRLLGLMSTWYAAAGMVAQRPAAARLSPIAPGLAVQPQPDF